MCITKEIGSLDILEENECLNCGCYDSDMGCTMPSVDKEYACTLENKE